MKLPKVKLERAVLQRATSYGQRIHLWMDEMYEMDRTYQKLYTQLAKEFLLS